MISSHVLSPSNVVSRPDARDFVASLAGFAVAAIVLAVLSVIVGIDAVIAAIGRADTGYVALVGAAILTWLCFWGVSLRAVLATIGTDLSLPDAILVNAGASFANHVTPFGQAGGEPVVALLVSDVSDTDFEHALAAMASFDTINVVPSLTLAAGGVTYYAAVTTVGTSVRVIATGLGLVGTLLAVLVYLGWRHPVFVETVLVRIGTPPLQAVGYAVPRFDVPTAPDIEHRVERFVGAFRRIAGNRHRLTVALSFSFGGWVAQALGLWFAFRALGAHLPTYVPLFVIPMGAMGNVLPTPGGLGGIETVQITLLVAVTGIAASTVAAAVTISSIGGFFLTTALGGASVALLQARSRYGKT